MPVLLDIALALLVFAGALFLGSVALIVIKDLKNGSSHDDSSTPPPSSK